MASWRLTITLSGKPVDAPAPVGVTSPVQRKVEIHCFKAWPAANNTINRDKRLFSSRRSCERTCTIDLDQSIRHSH